jgi:nonribosomal peptide synthetase DhbF
MPPMTDDLEGARMLWRNALSTLDEPVLLLATASAPMVPTTAAGALDRSLAAGLLDGLRRDGAGPAAFEARLLAAWALTLGCETGRKSLALGTALPSPAGHRLVPLPITWSAADTPGSLARAIATTRAMLAPVLDTPLRDIVDAGGRGELFDVAFAIDLPAAPPAPLADAALPLTVRLVVDGDGRLEARWRAGPLDTARVERILARFERAIAAVGLAADPPLGRLDLLDAAERRLALAPPAAASPPPCHLPDAFEAQVRATPEAIALTDGDRNLRYRELDAAANRLARALIARGAAPGTFIAVALPRSAELLVAILAVLKAGAAYVPLDPEYPADRLAYMLDDARPVVVVTHRPALDRIGSPASTLVIDDPATAAAIAALPATPPDDRERRAPLRPSDPAYVIYTSGSTGRPKGVVIPHLNVTRLLHATEGEFAFGPNDVWTLFHSCAFDVSVWEMWGAFLYGGRLVVVPYTVSRSPADFLDLLVRESVTVLCQTPSAFHSLVQADGERPEVGSRLRLREVIFAGEALQFGKLAPWYARHADDAPRLVNMYGITETTVHVTWLALDRSLLEVPGNSLIGRPIRDQCIHVLDAFGLPVPTGVVGEIHVGGAGLASGYLNLPELTSARFIADPNGSPGARLYRSGDLARQRDDGAFDYFGRADQQVKIRGFRIELGEIEAALVALPGLAQAAVIPREDRPGDLRLVAYVIPARDAPAPEPLALRRALATQLPDYMLPATYVVLPGLPLTTNGKLDRRALPVPAAGATPTGPVPGGDTENALAPLFAEVLGLTGVGLDDNFFDLGGNSLLMVRLHGMIRARLGLNLTVVDLFAAPSVQALARRLAGGDPHTSADAGLDSAQERARRARLAMARSRHGARPESRDR